VCKTRGLRLADAVEGGVIHSQGCWGICHALDITQALRDLADELMMVEIIRIFLSQFLRNIERLTVCAEGFLGPIQVDIALLPQNGSFAPEREDQVGTLPGLAGLRELLLQPPGFSNGS